MSRTQIHEYQMPPIKSVIKNEVGFYPSSYRCHITVNHLHSRLFSQLIYNFIAKCLKIVSHFDKLRQHIN